MTHEDNRGELRNASEEPHSERQEKVRPLWLKSVYDAVQQRDEDYSVLSQVRGTIPLAEGGTYTARLSSGVPTPNYIHTYDAATLRQLHGIQGRRADFVIVDDVAVEGWDFSDIERRVLASMVEELWSGIAAGVLLDGRDYRSSLARPAPAAEAEVFDGLSIAEYFRVPEQTKPGEVPKCGPKSVPVRRGNRGGRAKRDTRRGVHTDGKSARYDSIARKARACVATQYGLPTAACRAVAGPGSGWCSRECKTATYAGLVWPRVRNNQQSERPEEHNGQ